MRNLLFCGGFFKNSAFIRCASDRPLLALALARRAPHPADRVKNLARCAVLWRLRSSLLSMASLAPPHKTYTPCMSYVD